MKLCIDIDQCQKENIPIDTALYVASLYCGKTITKDTFNDVCSRGLIEFDGFTLQRDPVNARLTPTGINVIETIFLNSEFRTDGSSEDRYDRLAKKLQELFPEGKKAGTQYKWRDSQAIIAKKLKTVVKKFDVTFTDEQAIAATKDYIASFNGDFQFMQILRYFILKRDRITGEESSQFLSYIENLGQKDESNNNDWMNVVR